MATQQVLLGVSGTAFTPPALAATTINAFYDSREIQVARFSPDSFASKVTVSDADIEAYYKEHTAQFQAPEQASIEYLVLDLEAAKKNIVSTTPTCRPTTRTTPRASARRKSAARATS
jgi:peptidyl-prolyl cis-trans isomerase D